MPLAVRSVEFSLDFADNISATTEKAAQSQENLQVRVRAANASVMQQDVSFIKTVSSLSALRSGVTGVFSSLIMLGVVGDEGAKTLMKMSAGISLFVGSAQAVKGVIGLMNQLRNSEIALAAVETYRSVLHNPAMLGMVAMAGGAAAGVGGYLIGRSQGGKGDTTVNQNITFQGAPSSSQARGVARDTLQSMGG
jgi:hypothetical protein